MDQTKIQLNISQLCCAYWLQLSAPPPILPQRVMGLCPSLLTAALGTTSAYVAGSVFLLHRPLLPWTSRKNTGTHCLPPISPPLLSDTFATRNTSSEVHSTQRRGWGGV